MATAMPIVSAVKGLPVGLRTVVAVADSMRHFAGMNGADVDLWEAVGLLHDIGRLVLVTQFSADQNLSSSYSTF